MVTTFETLTISKLLGSPSVLTDEGFELELRKCLTRKALLEASDPSFKFTVFICCDSFLSLLDEVLVLKDVFSRSFEESFVELCECSTKMSEA